MALGGWHPILSGDPLQLTPQLPFQGVILSLSDRQPLGEKYVVLPGTPLVQ
jgi:hypothetical protein